MSYRIHCEQFVYGKLVGVRGARYKLIAKSPGISQDDAFEIYKGFNRCRPSATGIASFRRSYVTRLLTNGQIVLLRLARSREKELGRGHFLQERYVILHSDDANKAAIRPWLWLLAIPPTPPALSEYCELPDHLSLNEHEIAAVLKRAIGCISEDDSFQRSVLTALYYTLHSRPVAISFSKKAFDDYWTWLTALSILMPNSRVARTGLYIGSSIPHGCEADVSIVEDDSSRETVRYRNLLSQSGSMLALNRIKRGYTNLSWRCLETDDLQLLNELITTVENADVDALPATPTTPYDVLLWMAAMPRVGLQLAWNELNEAKLSIDDLQWLWRNSIESFTLDQVKVFLPILIRRTLPEWGETDFASLQELIKRMQGAVGEVNIDRELLVSFLERWMAYTTTFASYESSWFLSLLERLASVDPTGAITLLTKWIGKAERDSVFESVPGVAQWIRLDSVESRQYWGFVLALVCKATNASDLLSLRRLFRVVFIGTGEHPLERPIRMILGDTEDRHKTDMGESVLKDTISAAKESGVSVGMVVSVLFFLVLSARNEEMLVALAGVVSQAETSHRTHLPRLAKEVIPPLEHEWVFKSNSNELIGSFIFVTGKLGHRRSARQAMTTLLREEPERFSYIANYMQSVLRARQDDLAISLEQLFDLPLSRQLYLLVEYILSTQESPPTPPELERVERLLVTVPSLNGISLGRQAQLVSLFQELGEWQVCQRILEHQIRAALLSGNIAQGCEKLGHLNNCVKSMGMKYVTYELSILKADSIIRYWRALPEEQKEDFLGWLLTAPINEFPKIERRHSFLITSRILERNRKWLSNDPIVRLYLFAEAIRFVGQRYGYWQQ